jgi:multisubunit Na+/H+ antiporter MnhB subunit
LENKIDEGKKMKKIMMFFCAIFLPFIFFLIKDNPGMAFVALALQGCVIGWPVATVLALKELFSSKANAPQKEGK